MVKRMDKIGKFGFEVICMMFLVCCFVSMALINFSKNPDFYCTDMYSDMIYSIEVWEQKTVFPEGWVFGNQLYVVATPVLAGLFYGLTNDGCIAMGLATSVMGLLVVVSFAWMMKPLFKNHGTILCGLTSLVVLTLFAGNPVHSTNGWQLFFTMCSYYACYLITALLAFGCCLRVDGGWRRSEIGVLILACILAFGTGMQSLRQTVVMVCPIFAMEVLCVIFVKDRKIQWKSFVISGVIVISNMAGLVAVRNLDIAQYEIFHSPSIKSITEMLESVLPALQKMTVLINPFGGLLGIAIGVACVVATTIGIYTAWKTNNEKLLKCFLLLILSLMVILAIDILTKMSIREIYYFLLFPLVAVVIAALYENGSRFIRMVTIFGVLALMLLGTLNMYPEIKNTAHNDKYDAVVEYLEEQGINTVYSGWNHGEKIAIASEGEISAGFWRIVDAQAVRVDYLCNPEVFDKNPSECAFIFRGESNADWGVKHADESGTSLELLAYFPEHDLYIYKADKIWMKIP